jgi:hypothetical protein
VEIWNSGKRHYETFKPHTELLFQSGNDRQKIKRPHLNHYQTTDVGLYVLFLLKCVRGKQLLDGTYAGHSRELRYRLGENYLGFVKKRRNHRTYRRRYSGTYHPPPAYILHSGH